VEDLTKQEWANIRHLIEGKLLVNEAFALHHVIRNPIGGLDPKQSVLKRLYDLKPTLFVLAEPDSNHHSADLRIRFQNAWNHYGLVFQTIDALDLDRTDQVSLKTFFFGREIEDILSAPEDLRSERHESIPMWLTRLQKTGFKQTPQIYQSVDIETHSMLPAVTEKHRNHVSLNFERSSVVGVIAVTGS
jgi:hypothetical protein